MDTTVTVPSVWALAGQAVTALIILATVLGVLASALAWLLTPAKGEALDEGGPDDEIVLEAQREGQPS